MNIEIHYTGDYPNLCSGHLEIKINNINWIFPQFCLRSTGWIEDWEICHEGPWEVVEWPINFPEEQKEKVIEAINNKIERGCCGGCI